MKAGSLASGLATIFFVLALVTAERFSEHLLAAPQQPQLPPKQLSKVNGGLAIELRVTSKRDSFAPGDKLELELKIHNSSRSPQMIVDYIPFVGWAPKMVDRRGQQVPLEVPAVDTGVRRRSIIIPARGVRKLGSYSIQIPKDTAFGVYRLTQVYRVNPRSRQLTSEPVEIRVAAPRGEADAGGDSDGTPQPGPSSEHGQNDTASRIEPLIKSYPLLENFRIGMSARDFRAAAERLSIPLAEDPGTPQHFFTPTSDRQWLDFCLDGHQLVSVTIRKTGGPDVAQRMLPVVRYHCHPVIDVLLESNAAETTTYWWQGRATSGLKEIERKLRDLHKGHPRESIRVLIRADGEMRHRHLVELMDTITGIGDAELQVAILEEATYVIPFQEAQKEGGTILGRFQPSDPPAPETAYRVTLEHESWSTRLGRLPSLAIKPGERFEFRNVPPGKCKVSVTLDRDAVATASVEVAGGATAFLKLETKR